MLNSIKSKFMLALICNVSGYVSMITSFSGINIRFLPLFFTFAPSTLNFSIFSSLNFPSLNCTLLIVIGSLEDKSERMNLILFGYFVLFTNISVCFSLSRFIVIDLFLNFLNSSLSFLLN